MKIKILCDRCKREFEGDEELVDRFDVLCPDCEEDCAESEMIKDDLD